MKYEYSRLVVKSSIDFDYLLVNQTSSHVTKTMTVTKMKPTGSSTAEPAFGVPGAAN